MQLTLWLFGCEVFTLKIGQPDQPEPEPERDRGDCTTYPVGFTATFDRPDEADLPERG